MGVMKITDSITSVGVLNPNMRVFDIVMRTEFGTSYNSYLVKGSEKTALIEASHPRFFEYLRDNISGIADIGKIDYLVMNHNEPDHSGSIEKLLELNPELTILVSQAGSLYLKNIVNRADMKVQVVKDGDQVSLGDKTLHFINAPFLHWPDSMFTWCPEEKALFSCDFLGCHYCEPQMIDTKIPYPQAYEQAFEEYYQAIFGPFKPYVLKGLEKIKDLPIEYCCVSHGPVLTKDCRLKEAMDKYREWSTPKAREHKSIPVFYCSAYGNTGRLAGAIAEGIREALPDAAVGTFDIIEHDMGKLGALLNESDAFLIGSPTLNRDAVPPVWNLLAHVDAVNIQKRPVALFGSYGWSGEAVKNLSARLKDLKVNLFEKDFRVVFVPTEQDLEAAKAFGKEFAQSL